MDKIQKHIQLAAIVLGLLLPTILFTGYVYNLGYITQFGLSSSLASQDLSNMITESWYMGVLVLGKLVKWWYWPIILFLVLSVIFLVVMYWLSYLKSKGRLKEPEELNKQNQGRRILGLTQWHWVCWFEVVGTLYGWMLFPIVFLAVPINVLIFPFEHGKSVALTQIEELKAHLCDSNLYEKGKARCVSLVDINSTPNKTVTQGLLVSFSENRIALFDGVDLEVWTLTDSLVIKKSVIKEQ